MYRNRKQKEEKEENRNNIFCIQACPTTTIAGNRSWEWVKRWHPGMDICHIDGMELGKDMEDKGG